MDEFDPTFEGFTPNQDTYKHRPYRPPRIDEPSQPSTPEIDTRFQPIDQDDEMATKSPAPKPTTQAAPQIKHTPAQGERFKGKPSTADTAQQTSPKTDDVSTDDVSNSMQSESRKAKKKTHGDQPIGIIRFLTDERTRFFLGSVLLLTSIFLVIAIFSHFAHGGEDQSEVYKQTVSEMSENGQSVKNAGGNFGAWLSHVLLCDALGLGSLVLIPYMWILAFALFGVRKCDFWGTTFRCLLLAISTSVVIGYVTYNWGTEIYWGGEHGHYINQFLFNTTSWIGALIVSLILVAAVCAVYYNQLRQAWQKCSAAYIRHRESERARKLQRQEIERREAEQAEAARRQKEAQMRAESSLQETGDQDYNEPQDYDELLNRSETLKATDPEEFDRSAISIDDEGPITVTNYDDKDVIVIDNGDDNFSVTAQQIEAADNIATKPEAVGDGLYDHRSDLPSYNLPPIDLLEDRPSGPIINMEEQQANKELIEKVLLHYNIPITKIDATVGPTVTRYEIVPAEGVRINQIRRLEDDIALNLKAIGIRIIAPIPGKGTVGIEVPNNDPQTVSMRSVISSKKYQECKMVLPMAMGATISNEIFIADLAKIPHLLVAGATGMGKSVGLNAILASLLYKKHPSELKLVLIDPKMVEFSLYSKIERHFLAKLSNEDDAIITDMKKVIQTLNSLCIEMDERYELLRDANVRSLEEYNRKFTERRLSPNDGHRYLPYIVVVVDEFADLIMTQGKEIENPIGRIAQKARAVGIHMILATQRPSTNVITGLIKANFPGRIAFRVIQMVDSRTILDCPGANQLIGRGDMLFSLNGSMERVQCAFISTEEVEQLADYINHQPSYEHAYYLPEYTPEEAEGGVIAGASTERDPYFNEAARFVVTRQLGSTSSLQRQFGIGYNRAGKLMDQMEAAGIVGPVNGAKPRAILMDIVTLESILGD